MVSKKVLESEIESYLRKSIEALDGECVKFIPDYKRGWPDRLVLLPGGTVIWVETKRPEGGKVSPAQRVAHVMLRRLGHRVELIWTREQVDRLVESLKTG